MNINCEHTIIIRKSIRNKGNWCSWVSYEWTTNRCACKLDGLLKNFPHSEQRCLYSICFLHCGPCNLSKDFNGNTSGHVPQLKLLNSSAWTINRWSSKISFVLKLSEQWSHCRTMCFFIWRSNFFSSSYFRLQMVHLNIFSSTTKWGAHFCICVLKRYFPFITRSHAGQCKSENRKNKKQKTNRITYLRT